MMINIVRLITLFVVSFFFSICILDTTTAMASDDTVADTLEATRPSSSIPDNPKNLTVLASSPVPKIRVSGNKLLAGGLEIRFRGVNVIDPIKNEREFGQFKESYYKMAADWGANIIRMPIFPVHWNNTQKDKHIIEQSIEWAAKHGMYTIIDWHPIGSPITNYYMDPSWSATTQAETEQFWKYIAQKYKGDPRVAAYELWNEPLHSADGWNVSQNDWVAMRDWYERTIDMVRAIDPDTPVICNGLDWGYNLQYAGANPVRRQGVIYGVHPYPNQDIPWDTFYGYLTANYPVFATEFGFDNNGGTYDEYQFAGGGTYRTEIDNYLESKGIHWTAWCMSTSWEPRLLSDWTTPSESGTFFKNAMSARNTETK